jgi:hypothetical protein
MNYKVGAVVHLRFKTISRHLPEEREKAIKYVRKV